MSARATRVVTLVDRLGAVGGGERLAMEVAMRLDPARYERTLCVTRPALDPRAAETATEAASELGEANVRLLQLERGSRVDLAAWQPLVSLIRRERVDLLHAHKFGSNVWGAVLGRLCRVPVVVAHEHTWSFEGRPLRRLLDRQLIARWSDAFIVVSREDRRRMIEIEKVDPRDVVLLPNGIPALPSVVGDVRRELDIPPGAPVVGTVAVLRPQKALDVLVRAVAELIEDLPALHLVIAGDGERRPQLERLVDDLGLGGAVHLLGRRSDIPDVLAALDVAVCCSHFEGSPLSVMEYMAAGKPVVASRVGGVPDLIEDGVHGLLVGRGDRAALASAIGHLLRHPERARRMGETARERQGAEFDIDAMVGRVEALYEDLLALKRDGR